MDVDKLLQALNQGASEFTEEFTKASGVGKEDRRRAAELKRELQGYAGNDAPKMVQTLDQLAATQTGGMLFGLSSDEGKATYEDLGLAPPSTKEPFRLAGHVAGSITGDLVQDASRSVWWLINAPQAVANIATELAVNQVNPYLWGAEQTPIRVSEATQDKAVAAGLVSPDFKRLMPGVGVVHGDDGKAYYSKRYRQPGHIEMLAVPTGIATNAAMGLMTPFGGAPGYEAVIPREDDPSKTANVIAEVASKYILGRTGNLLPYDEFKKVRPDVSPEEYRAYKAFKYDKDIDLDPRDGDITLPAGVAKFTAEGIHGPELQFLGRSLPVTTGFVPFAGALAGTVAGAHYRPEDGRRGPYVKRGLLGGLAGLAGGTIVGNLIERERQRRNSAANNVNTQPLDPETSYSAY